MEDGLQNKHLPHYFLVQNSYCVYDAHQGILFHGRINQLLKITCQMYSFMNLESIGLYALTMVAFLLVFLKQYNKYKTIKTNRTYTVQI